MAPHPKPPRLWLRPERPGRPAQWIILDRKRQVSLGRLETDRMGAEGDLEAYLQGRYSRRKRGQQRPTHQFDRSHWGQIYFATCDRDDFPVKIGWALDVAARIRGIQTAMPWPAVVLATCWGPISRERQFHRKFRKQRLQGEWFTRTPELLAFIATVQTDYPLLAPGRTDEERERRRLRNAHFRPDFRERVRQEPAP